MSCKLCGSGNTASLCMRTQHIYCHTCGGHEYEGALIDRKVWDLWVNGGPEPEALSLIHGQRTPD